MISVRPILLIKVDSSSCTSSVSDSHRYTPVNSAMNAANNYHKMTTLPKRIGTKLRLTYYAVEAFKLTVLS